MLCEACQRIGLEFDTLFEGFVPARDHAASTSQKDDALVTTTPRYHPVKHHTSWQQLVSSSGGDESDDSKNRKGCELCRLIVEEFAQWSSTTTRYFAGQLFTFTVGDVVYDETHGGILSLKLFSHENHHISGSFDLCAASDDDAAIAGLVRGRPIFSDSYLTSISDTVLPWMDECFQKHHGCCIPPDHSGALPTRVIDVGSAGNLLEPPRNPFIVHDSSLRGAFIALSHCWGGKVPASTTTTNIESRKKRLSLQDLPQNFVEAINVTRMLGFRYLWIDSLCIIQDDKLDWAREAMLMSKVYQGAAITLIANSASHSNAGFLKREIQTNVAVPYQSADRTKPGDASARMQGTLYIRKRIHGELEGPLQDRAWTLQEEVLSPRNLYFTSERLVWICHHGTRREGDTDKRFVPKYGEPIPVRTIFADLTIDNLSEDRASKEFRIMTHWYKLVSIYASRNLTQETDRFLALAALAQTVNSKTSFQYKAGLWLEDMHRGLLWFQRQNGGRRQRQSTAPSWSWASQDFTGWPAAYGLVENVEFSRKEDILATIGKCEVTTLYEDTFGQATSATLQIRGPMRTCDSLSSDPRLLIGYQLTKEQWTEWNAEWFHRHAQIVCLIDDSTNWGLGHEERNHVEWMKKSEFKQKTFFLQVARWSRNRNDSEKTVYALILESTGLEGQYRRRGLAVISPRGDELLPERWEVRSINII